MNPKKLPAKFQAWVDVRKKHQLTHMHIQMARELGLDPKKFDRLDNHKDSEWKEPLPTYLKTLYSKRFSKLEPENVQSIEHLYRDQQLKKQEKKLAKERAIKTQVE